MTIGAARFKSEQGLPMAHALLIVLDVLSGAAVFVGRMRNT
jgi:hypothetical protein